MNYNWVQIGDRIKQEREKAGLSQSQLMQKIGRSEDSYRILGRWEKGITQPCFTDMLSLCNVFECELGYLLCEYNRKTREITDIQEVTGLSDIVIETLKNLKIHIADHKGETHVPVNYFTILNSLLISPKFLLVVMAIDKYTQSAKNESISRKKRIEAENQFFKEREDKSYADYAMEIQDALGSFLKKEVAEVEKQQVQLWRIQQTFIELVKTIAEKKTNKN